MKFKAEEFEGHYVVGEPSKFKNLFVGMIPKIVWVDDKECATNPSNLSLYLNDTDISYRIEGETMTISNLGKEFKFRRQ